MLNPSDTPPEQQSRLLFLKQLLHKHPLAFCCGLWLTLMVLGSVATVGLFSPGLNEQQPSKARPTPTTIQEHTSKTIERPISKDPLSLSSFAVIAISCAAGSVLIAQLLLYSTQTRPSLKRLKPSSTIPKKRRHPSKKRRSAIKTQSPVSSELSVRTTEEQLQTTNNQLAQITVLPPEESHPLGVDKENLADTMDLRKRYSLAYLIRNRT